MVSLSCASASSRVMVLLVMTSFRCWKKRSSNLFENPMSGGLWVGQVVEISEAGNV